MREPRRAITMYLPQSLSENLNYAMQSNGGCAPDRIVTLLEENLYTGSNHREYTKLNDTQKEILCTWIKQHIIPSNRTCSMHSYGLKHEFHERCPQGFYVNNGAFKGAMLDCGFTPIDKTELNWEYKAKYTK